MTTIRTKSLVALAVLIGTLGATGSALAQDNASKAAARAAGYEGVQAFEQGDFDTAATKLEQAFGTVKVPTLGLWYARALEKRGKLVEAAERYEETIGLPVKTGKRKEQKEAQAEAADELVKLRLRIPILTIAAKGSPEGIEITLDDIVLSAAVLGSTRPTNPGLHYIKATRGDRAFQWDVTLAEAENQTTEIDLTVFDAPLAEPPPPPPPVAPPPGPLATNLPMDHPAEPGPIPLRTYGWVALGLGGLATVTGVVAGLMVKSKKDRLDASNDCTGTQCLPAQRDLRESYNSYRTVSTVSFVVGAVGLGAGTALLVTTPKTKEKSHTTAWVGLGTAGLDGSF